MPLLGANTQLYPVAKIALGGLNTFDDPSDIQDNEMVNVRNMVFEDGIIQPRKGSLLTIDTPSYFNELGILTTETQTPTQMLKATDSAGVDYLIGVYGTNFYLWDTKNNQWILLNDTTDNGYTPFNDNLFYGSANWNNGLSDDRLYFGNGNDDTMKWQMAISTLALPISVGDTTITLNNTSAFPSSGTVLIATSTGVLILPYKNIAAGYYKASTIAFTATNTITDTANGFVTNGFQVDDRIRITGTKNNNQIFTITKVVAGTITVLQDTVLEAKGSPIQIERIGEKVLTLVTPIDKNIPVGVTVTMPIENALDVPQANVFCKSQARLFVANAVGAENTIHYSVAGDPENYTISSNVDSGGFYTLYRGKGGILGMTDYGQFLTIEKVDTISQFSFNVAADNTGFIVEVNPLISGDGIGPANNSEILNYMNELYYPTQGEGIVSFSPTTTGTSTTTGVNLLSQKINNLVTNKLDFTTSRTCGLNQKLYWTVALPSIGTPAGINNLVLMYDLVRASENQTASAWTIFDNWNAIDIKPVNGKLYFISTLDGALYEAYQGYQDEISGEPTAYTSGFLTKRFNLNSSATLMKAKYIYMEGLVSQGTKFYANVFANEGGSLATQSYQISGSNTVIVSNAFTGGLGAFVLGSGLLGGVDLKTIETFSSPLFFRVYLEVSQATREHNLQLQIFSNEMGSQWGISNICLITEPEQSIETALVMSPSSAPAVTL